MGDICRPSPSGIVLEHATLWDLRFPFRPLHPRDGIAD